MAGKWTNQLREWARRLKGEIAALWFCTRHPRTPFVAKALAAALVAYAFSPIDLIPDFIPVLGYLDELILLPICIHIILKMVPDPVLIECRADAKNWIAQNKPTPRSITAAVVIVLLWMAFFWVLWKYWGDYVIKWLSTA